MNAQSKIEHETTVNMTSKGQVLIPKALRELSGLMPNGPVRVGLNDRGETVVLPAEPSPTETREQRKARIRAALEAAKGSISLGGMTTDEYMRWLRGDREP
jgi:bifunctional DNA-binding transcriptional regulator/antitoxin component of YhaV-PrlF toxin-antitoxin module